MQIGNKIKKIRELRNFTQKYLADELSLSQSAYSKIEMGETEITYARLEKIAAVFEMKLEDIITFSDNALFNISNNTGNGNLIANVSYSLTEVLIKSYEDQIQSLKEEVSFLKMLLQQTMDEKRNG
jgi:transcriptional regulator with XRE-family HTH domain